MRGACLEELKLEPEDLPVEAPAGADTELLADEPRLSARVADLRVRRERVGPVNPLAEQEFADLSARCAELTRQRDDLQQTIEVLTNSIRKMDKESRERFLGAFGEIRRHFREQFALLFRGGRADLLLDDEENPLECGIEILCQPPGKKLQAVSLLLNNKLASLAGAVASGDAAPTEQSYVVYEDLVGRIDKELGTLKTLLSTDVAAFNALVKQQDVPAVLIK